MPFIFIIKSHEHALNVSVLNPGTNFISPQFCIICDKNDFQTVAPSGSNTLPPNWKDVFIITHHNSNTSFISTAPMTVTPSSTPTSTICPASLSAASEGDTVVLEEDISSAPITIPFPCLNPSNLNSSSESDGSFV